MGGDKKGLIVNKVSTILCLHFTRLRFFHNYLRDDWDSGVMGGDKKGLIVNKISTIFCLHFTRLQPPSVFPQLIAGRFSVFTGTIGIHC